MHQLPAHAASPEGVVRRLPLEGPRDHRGAHAGVRVRARHLQRARGRQATRHHVSGRAGQRLQDLGQLREPVLAGRVPDRPDRPRSPHPFRRGRIQRHRAVDSQAARRPGRDRTPGARPDADRARHARDLSRLGANPELHRLDRSGLGGPRSICRRRPCRRTTSPTAAPGRSARSRSSRGREPCCACTSTRTTSTSSWAAAEPCGRSSTASRPGRST